MPRNFECEGLLQVAAGFANRSEVSAERLLEILAMQKAAGRSDRTERQERCLSLSSQAPKGFGPRRPAPWPKPAPNPAYLRIPLAGQTRESPANRHNQRPREPN